MDIVNIEEEEILQFVKELIDHEMKFEIIDYLHDGVTVFKGVDLEKFYHKIFN